MKEKILLDPKKRYNKRISDVYNKSRPSYPVDLFIFLKNLFKKDRPLCLDIGCGTGISSRQLLDYGFEVIGIDSSLSMLEIAIKHSSKSISFINCYAEKIGINQNMVDLITAGQSFHWFEKKAAILEFYRILNSEGYLGIFWNTRDKSKSFTIDFEQFLVLFFPEYIQICIREKNGIDFIKNCIGDFFSKTREFHFKNYQRLTIEGFINRCLSSSFIHHGLNEKNTHQFLKELTLLFQKYSNGNILKIDYICSLFLFKAG